MRNRFLDERTARDIDTLIAKILRGVGRPEPPLILDDVRALQKLDRHYYSSVDEGPLREFVSRAYIGAKQVFSRPTLILDVVRKRSLKALYLYYRAPKSQVVLGDTGVEYAVDFPEVANSHS